MALNFQNYRSSDGNPLGFGFGKGYGDGSSVESPHRRLRRPPANTRLPPVEGSASQRSLTPPQLRRDGGAFIAASPMRPTDLDLGASHSSLNSSFASSQGGFGRSAAGGAFVDDAVASRSRDDIGALFRMMESRFSAEAGARDALAREVRALRDHVSSLERERDESRAVLDAVRTRHSALAEAFANMRDARAREADGGGSGGSGGVVATEVRVLRADLSSAHSRLDALARGVDALAAAGGPGGAAEAALRALHGSQREIVSMVEAETRSRLAAEESLGARVGALARKAADEAAAAALKEKERRSQPDADITALDARTVVTKPILETYLSGLRVALESEMSTRAREITRVEAATTAALDRAAAQMGVRRCVALSERQCRWRFNPPRPHRNPPPVSL
jgi:hypothetical protein